MSKDTEFSEFYQLAKNWGAGIKSQAQTVWDVQNSMNVGIK